MGVAFSLHSYIHELLYFLKLMFCNHPSYFPRRKGEIGRVRGRMPKIWKSSLVSYPLNSSLVSSWKTYTLTLSTKQNVSTFTTNRKPSL